MPPAEAGKRLYQIRGCAQCHNIDGTNNIGPTFKDSFGKSHAVKDGSQVTVEENYIRESILEPQAKIVAGYQGVMPTYKGRLKDDEITAIIEFIKTLGDDIAAEGGETEQK
jgi:cytochrome c oxidase subunit 2